MKPMLCLYAVGILAVCGVLVLLVMTPIPQPRTVWESIGCTAPPGQDCVFAPASQWVMEGKK